MLVPIRGVKFYANALHFQALTTKSSNNSSFQWIFPKKEIQNHKIRYQCVHPKVKISNAISVVGVYRAAILSEKFSSEFLIPTEASDYLSYLVLEKSYYTNK